MLGTNVIVRIVDEYGPHCVSPEDGQRLFDRLVEALRLGKSIGLDFTKVETISTVFLNVAIGKLFGRFEADLIERLVRWGNIADADDRLIRLVIRNAKAHYKMSAEARAREAEIVSKALCMS